MQEAGPDLFDVCIDDAEVVRVDARRTAGSVYSVLIGSRQCEASVDEREDFMLDVHVATSAFDFRVVDERYKLLVGSADQAVAGKQVLKCQMPGKIVKVLVEVGGRVETDQALLVIEAMKMENEVRSPIDGVVTEIAVAEGDAVESDAVLLVVEPDAEED